MKAKWTTTAELGLAHVTWPSQPQQTVCGISYETVYIKRDEEKPRCSACAEEIGNWSVFRG